jgi:hypothetical protein
MATYLILLILATSMLLFSSTITSFDLNNFNCSSPYTTSYDSEIQVRSCTFLPSTTFTDLSQLEYLSSYSTNRQYDCCTQCTTINCDFFVVNNLQVGNYECNFYSVANTITTKPIDLCFNEYLITGYPAIPAESK